MKFSVIVPVYGVEKYLDECVESVLAQTYGDFELILVDDCSPDSCPAMCDEWAKKDSRIRVIHKPVNEGLGFARNTGIDAAQGEYILFLDSDDYIHVDTLKLCEENLRDSKDVLVFGMELRYEDAAGNAKSDSESVAKIAERLGALLGKEMLPGVIEASSRHDGNNGGGKNDDCRGVEEAGVHLRVDSADRRRSEGGNKEGRTDKLEYVVDEVHQNTRDSRREKVAQFSLKHHGEAYCRKE